MTVSSLSSKLITSVVESDWLTPSQFVIKDLGQNPTFEQILQHREKRNGIVYHIHNTVSIVIRVIAVLAINSSPC